MRVAHPQAFATEHPPPHIPSRHVNASFASIFIIQSDFLTPFGSLFNRHNQNQERLRCRLGHLPTTLIEVGAAPGNYSIRIRAITPASNGSTWTPYTYFKIEEKVAAAAPTSNNIVIGIGSGAAFLIILLLITIVYYIHVKK